MAPPELVHPDSNSLLSPLTIRLPRRRAAIRLSPSEKIVVLDEYTAMVGGCGCSLAVQSLADAWMDERSGARGLSDWRGGCGESRANMSFESSLRRAAEGSCGELRMRWMGCGEPSSMSFGFCWCGAAYEPNIPQVQRLGGAMDAGL